MRIGLDEWRARGRMVALPDGRVFALEAGPDPPAAQDRDAVLFLHAFPTSSWDFADVADIVASDRRIVLFDFPGFGFSDKPADAAYSLFEQADAAAAVLRDFGVSRAHIWAHDMGTSVATELIARRERGLLPFDVASLVLMNAGTYGELARPTLAQRLLMSPAGDVFARATRKPMFVAQMRRIFGVAPAPAVLDAMWSLVSREEGIRRWPVAVRFTRERVRFRRRWLGALQRIDVPVLIAWGARDPVAPLAIAERLARETPGAELVSWADLGHYPQVEDPARVAAAAAAFFARIEARSRAVV